MEATSPNSSSSPLLIEKSDSFLKLERPIVFFDLETTGVKTQTDRIVEICAIKINMDGSQEELHHLINPTISIPPEATAIHGITNEMVAGKKSFMHLADEIAAFFKDCDLGGYNIKNFDVPMLMEEFHRFKKYPININEVKLVDAMSLYHHKEKRDLTAAVRFYCGREHEEAHSAKADVLATIDILKHQLLKYPDLEANTSFLHDLLSAGAAVDGGRKFKRDKEGEIIFNFGKHYGKQACSEPDYLKWMFESGDFGVDTKMVAKKIYKNCRWDSEIKTWLQKSKVSENLASLSALYTSVKFEKEVFPFSITRKDEMVTVTYLVEPPITLVLPHPDAVRLLLAEVDRILKK